MAEAQREIKIVDVYLKIIYEQIDSEPTGDYKERQ